MYSINSCQSISRRHWPSISKCCLCHVIKKTVTIFTNSINVHISDFSDRTLFIKSITNSILQTDFFHKCQYISLIQFHACLWYSKQTSINIIRKGVYSPTLDFRPSLMRDTRLRIVTVVLDRNFYLGLTKLCKPPCVVLHMPAPASARNTIEPPLCIVPNSLVTAF